MRIIITGASSGLGEALALHYAHEKNDLVLIARREEKLQKVADACLHWVQPSKPLLPM